MSDNQLANADSRKGRLFVKPEEWKPELERSAEKYHTIGAWVAIIFDPVFGITDYFNIPDGWLQIFALRLSVSAITLIAMYLFRKKKINTFFFIAIPLFLISLQNAYTYSLIGQENILGHNLNYLALFMGAGLFIIWPLTYSLIAIGVSMAASFGFIFLNESIEPSVFAVNGGILLVTGAAFSILLIQARYTARLREIKARLALDKSLAITEAQKNEIARQNQKLEAQAVALSEANEQIEAANRKLQDQNLWLEEKVRERTAELQKSNDERDQIVYRLSHDFKTPMLNIQAFLGLAAQTEDAGDRKHIFDQIDISLDRFNDLLRDMESFPVYTRENLNPRDIVPAELMQSLWESFAPLRTEEDELSFTGRTDMVLHADPEKLRVIFQGILANSLRYRQNGQPALIEFEITQQAGNNIFRLSDNGSGIPENVLPRVFEMFYRGDPRSTGAGLGLYLSKGLTEQLEGTISIDSAENGTTVMVKLPIKSA